MYQKSVIASAAKQSICVQKQSERWIATPADAGSQ
jgi:hypothetical protein